MSDRATTVMVDVHDALPEVLARLRSAEGDSICLQIPEGSPVLLTATEFRVLKDTADGADIRLTVRTDDPLRVQLAAMFNVPTDHNGTPAATFTAATRSRPPVGSGQSPLPIRPLRLLPSQRARAATADGWGIPLASREAPDAKPRDEAAEANETQAAAGADPISGPDAESEPPASEERDAADEAEPASSERTRVEHTPAPASSTAVPSAVVTLAGSDLSGQRRSPLLRIGDAARAAIPTSVVARPKPSLTFPEWLSIERLREMNTRSRSLLIGTVLFALALATAATVLLLPRATVAVVLRSQPVSTEMVYSVAAAGTELRNGAAFNIVAEPFTTDVTFDDSIPTTGARMEPDATATGVVRLVNPFAEEITIEEGTIITSDEGVGYVVTEAVSVPAFIPDEERGGGADAQVRADQPGTIGNVDQGVLTGRLDIGIYYSNRDGAITGGTDTIIPVVAEEDLATLEAKAETELPGLIERAFQGALPAGDDIVPSSVQVGDPTYAFNREVGEDAESISIRAVMPVTALKYNPEAALAQVRQVVRNELAAESPEDYELNDESLILSTPAPVAEQDDAVQFRVTADAEFQAIFTDDQRRAVARDLAGKDGRDVEAVLIDVPSIDAFDITYAPRWLPDRMPPSANRIDIETAG